MGICYLPMRPKLKIFELEGSRECQWLSVSLVKIGRGRFAVWMKINVLLMLD
jgi:hypothetical protein